MNLTFFILVFIQIGFAQTSQEILKDMTLTYSNVEYMKTNYEKTEVSELLGDEKTTHGQIEYSKGRIRIEEDSEARNIFIKNKEKFWHLQEDNQVLTGSTKQSVPTVFEMMFQDPKVWDGMTSNIVGKKGDEVNLKINVDGKIPNVKILKMTINTKKRRFEKISFDDDIGNQTKINFKNTKFFRSVPGQRFTYEISKKDNVNEL